MARHNQGWFGIQLKPTVYVAILWRETLSVQLLACNNKYCGLVPALGQVMLYVDGMNGVIDHNETVQWLYALTASKVSLSGC